MRLTLRSLLICCCLGGMWSALTAAIVPSAPDAVILGSVAVVPLQPIVEILGGKLATDSTGAVTATANGKTFACRSQKTTAMSNGKAVTLPLAPFMRSQVLYVPLSPLVTAWGGTLSNQPAAHTVTASFPRGVSLVMPTVTMKLSPAAFANSTADPDLYLMNLDGTGLQRLTYDETFDWAVSLSRDQTRLVRYRGALVTTRLLNQPNERILARDAPALPARKPPVIHPDGESVYYIAEINKQYSGIDFDGKSTDPTASYNLSFSDDGILMASFSSPTNGRYCVIVYHTQRYPDDDTVCGYANELLAVSADGKQIIGRIEKDVTYPDKVHGIAAQFVIFRLGANPKPTLGKYFTVTTIPPKPESLDTELLPAFSPDGSRFAYCRYHHVKAMLDACDGIFTANTDRTDEKLVMKGVDPVQLAYAPDGQHLLFLQPTIFQIARNTIAEGNMLHSVKLDGTELTSIAKHLAPVWFTVTADGKKLLVAATRMK